MNFAAASMRPVVDVACGFVRASGKRPAISELPQPTLVLVVEAGTTIDATDGGIAYTV